MVTMGWDGGGLWELTAKSTREYFRLMEMFQSLIILVVHDYIHLLKLIELYFLNWLIFTVDSTKYNFKIVITKTVFISSNKIRMTYIIID